MSPLPVVLPLNQDEENVPKSKGADGGGDEVAVDPCACAMEPLIPADSGGLVVLDADILACGVRGSRVDFDGQAGDRGQDR